MSKTCLLNNECFSCSKDTELDISRINIGPFLIICLDQDFGDDEVENKENVGFFLVGTGQCLYEALLILADSGIDVDNDCVIAECTTCR